MIMKDGVMDEREEERMALVLQILTPDPSSASHPVIFSSSSSSHHPIIITSLQSKQGAQSTLQSAETHEREAQQARSDKYDAHALHALGNLDQRLLLAQTGENDQRQRKAKCRRKGIDHALEQAIVFLNDKDSHTEHGTVGRDQREEDAERLIQSRRDLLQDDLHHLHKRGNHQDEGKRL